MDEPFFLGEDKPFLERVLGWFGDVRYESEPVLVESKEGELIIKTGELGGPQGDRNLDYSGQPKQQQIAGFTNLAVGWNSLPDKTKLVIMGMGALALSVGYLGRAKK